MANMTLLRAAIPLAVLATAVGCSDPCRDYCEVGVERINECHVATSVDRDKDVDDCTDLLDDASSDQCDDALAKVENASCDEIAALYCPHTPPSAAGPACTTQ